MYVRCLSLVNVMKIQLGGWCSGLNPDLRKPKRAPCPAAEVKAGRPIFKQGNFLGFEARPARRQKAPKPWFEPGAGLLQTLRAGKKWKENLSGSNAAWIC